MYLIASQPSTIISLPVPNVKESCGPMALGTTAAQARDLYRAMADDGGTPLVHPRNLGVRTTGPHIDIEADAHGIVRPSAGGMSVTPDDPSVTPDDPMELPRHVKPPKLGGRGKRPVWLISSALIADQLATRQDEPTHWLIEPSSPMVLHTYESALAATAPQWARADV